ncbi:MAG: hypothetical protein ACTSRC_15465 [Candidatus Helarchaeota archaeon]
MSQRGKKNQSLSLFFIVIFCGSLVVGNFFGEKNWNSVDSTLLSEKKLTLSNGVIETPQIVVQKNFTYSGENQTDAQLTFFGTNLLSSSTATDITIATHDWNVSDVLVNFTNIRIDEQIHVEEETPPDSFVTIYNDSVGGNAEFYAMQFIVPESCFIFGLKVFIRYKGNFSLQAYILNSHKSTFENPGQPIPNDQFAQPVSISEEDELVTSESENITQWVELHFNPRATKAFLDISKTFLNSYFVVLVPTHNGDTTGDFFQWGYQDDNTQIDHGHAYQVDYVSVEHWKLAMENLTTIDLLLTNISYSTITWEDSFDVENDNDGYILVYNKDLNGGIEEYRLNAQAFQIISNAYLRQLEVYLKYQGAVQVYVDVYNSTDSSISNPNGAIPDTVLFSSLLVELSSGIGYDRNWVTFEFPNNETADSSFLNLENTFNNTFFIVLHASGAGIIPRASVEWSYAFDSSNEDAGSSYFWNVSYPPEYWMLQEDSPDIAEPIDLTLKNVELFTYEQNPSDVSLEVNGTAVTDYGYINFGGWIALPGPFEGNGGQLYLDTTASILNIRYIALWTCKFTNQTQFYTQFRGRTTETQIQWNYTNYVSFPSWNFSRYGFGLYYLRQINVTLPIDHNVTQINPTKPYTINSTGNQKYIIINVQNRLKQSWLINAISPNYVDEIITYNGSSEVEWYYFLEEMNVTARLKYNTGVYTYLKIYNVTEDIVNTSRVIPNQDTTAKFPLWTINANGTHYAVVYWFNGTEVGIKHVVRMCVFRTNLSKVFSNIIEGIPFDPAEPIQVDVFYNDTDNNEGIPAATIEVNTTAAYSALEDTIHRGIYNVTIFPESLENGNYTLQIHASRIGYEASDTYIRFQILRNATAYLNITGGCRDVVNGKEGWVDPDPYFDDQTHTVTVFYSNETGYGIKYAQVIANPDWTTTTWFGGPTNVTPGFYDILIDTNGLHEGDIGLVTITVYSELYETKTVTVYVNITEIPSNLLLIDAGEYNNITAYEGETIKVAVGYWDNFHGNPILFSGPEEGNLTWEIGGTSAQGLLGKSVWQYEADISLPEWGILGTHTYNITITAVAAQDYAIKIKNVTLNVLAKEKTTLVLTNTTPTEYRIGQSFNIYANLTYYNGTPLVGETIDLNITHWLDGEFQFALPHSLVTNEQGMVTYEYMRIPPGIDEIRINGTYVGTEKISPAEDFQIIPIKPKYNVTLLLGNTTTTDYRIGHDMTLYAKLLLENGTPLIEQTVIFNLTYFNGPTEKQNIIEPRVTNESGIAFYEIDVIPDGVDSLIFIASFRATLTMNGNKTGRMIPIAPKYQVVLNITSTLPSQIMAGDALEFTLLLENNITKTGISNESVWVILHFAQDTQISQKFATDSNGIASVQMIIPSDKGGYDSFIIELWFEGTTTAQTANMTMQTAIAIMTWGKIILGWLPYIVTAVAIALGSYVGYKRGVVVPRRRRRLARMEKLAAKFSDIVNLQHLLVIHGKSGTCLYQQVLGDTTLDADLISGFLTAISAFQTEIQAPKTQKLPFIDQKHLEGEKREDQGFELSYANFKILMKDGNMTRTAVILATTPTESLRDSLNEFVRQFESKYEDELRDWKGAVGIFRTADAVVELAFETSLLWPHIVEPTSAEEIKKLNSLESSLLTLGSTMQQEKQYFFIPALVEMIEKVRRETHVEVLGTIDELRQKGIFRAVPIEVLEEMIKKQSNSNS